MSAAPPPVAASRQRRIVWHGGPLDGAMPTGRARRITAAWRADIDGVPVLIKQVEEEDSPDVFAWGPDLGSDISDPSTRRRWATCGRGRSGTLTGAKRAAARAVKSAA